MTDSTPPKSDSSAKPTQSETNVSGGVNFDAQHDVNIGGDAIGRDKVISATYHIEHATFEASTSTIPISVGEPPAPGETPYKGLQYFDEGDTELFFGREQLTAQLVARLHNEAFLAVVGASGSGKSSLVRAGLVPALRREHPHWQIHVIAPTAHPIKELAASLTREAESLSATTTLIDDLTRDARSLDLAATKVLKQSKQSERLLLIVDQFEELFTACKDETEQRAFVDNLMHAVTPDTNGSVIVIIALRADFYARCARFDALRQALEQHQAYIGSMSKDELRRAIETPAQRKGWLFESGLVDLLLHDVASEPGALPLLSHALLATWQRRRGHTMTLTGYTEAGGVNGAIAKTADEVMNSLQPEQQLIARNIFLRLTEVGEDTQDMRRRAALSELTPRADEALATEQVLKTLADARLITTDEEAAEVAHEALIREWPALRTWLNEDREGLRLHRQLTDDVQEWVALQRDEGALYRGTRLDRAINWAKTHADALNPVEREFYDASVALRERERVEREGVRRRARYLVAALIAVLLVGVVAVAFAIRLSQMGVTSVSPTALTPVINEVTPTTATRSQATANTGVSIPSITATLQADETTQFVSVPNGSPFTLAELQARTLTPTEKLDAPTGSNQAVLDAVRIWNKYGGLIEPLASSIGIDSAAAVALTAVQSSGSGVGSDGRMIIRFENHLFWDNWGKNNPAIFNKYFAFDQNSPWTGHQYRTSPSEPWLDVHQNQESEWSAFTLARGLDSSAAIRSTSMGLFLLLASDYGKIGYDTPEAMFASYSTDERFQMLGFFNFVKSDQRLITALQSEDFVSFARIYNGPGQPDYYGNLMKTVADGFRSLRPAPKPATVASRTRSLLEVPYKNQNDPDANLRRSDSGQASLAMIFAAIKQNLTTNDVTVASGVSEDVSLEPSQVVTAAKALGLEMSWRAGYTLDDLKRFVASGQPSIALIKYANIPDRIDKGLLGAHYVLVVGYDDETNEVIINDPDYFPGTSGGYQKSYAYQIWQSAWGGFAADEQPNFTLIVPNLAKPIADRRIFEEVQRTIVELLNVPASKITLESRFEQDLKADELDMIELTMAFEEVFSKEVSDADAHQFITVNDVVLHFQKHAETGLPVRVVPWGKSFAGVAMQTPRPFTAEELKALADSKVEAIKILTLGDAAEAQQLITDVWRIRPDMFIVARLYYPVYSDQRILFTPQDFVNSVDVGMKVYYDAGVRYFEIHNEPNMEAEGMGWNWANGAEFGNWFTQVYTLIKQRYPEAKLGYPGLSPQPNVDAFLDSSATAANSADWIGVHSYWQQPPGQPPYPMDGDNAGYYWRAKFNSRFPNKMLMITEFSNNSATVSPEDKGKQYAHYYQLLRNEPNIGGAFSFALSWPGQDSNHEGWAGTTIPSTVGALIGKPGYLP